MASEFNWNLFAALLLLAFCYFQQSVGEEKVKICALKNLITEDVCKNLQSTGAGECVYVDDSIDCALRLKFGEANLATFTTEQGLVVGDYLKNVVEVIGDVRDKVDANDFAFETVVLVEEKTIKSRQDLQGKKFCHPGFNFEKLFSQRVLKYFEDIVVPQQCSDGKKGSPAEDEALSISKFFSQSCRPGNWIQDVGYDKYLKDKYKNLCELCGDKEKCQYSYGMDPISSAMNCITTGLGQIAYVEKSRMERFFKDHPNANPRGFSFLCPNGTVTISACPWIQQPWPTIVATNQSEAIARELLINDERPGSREVSYILKNSIDTKYISVEGRSVYLNTSIMDYVTKGRHVPLEQINKCNRKVKWCTGSDLEKEKCNWLASSADVAGIKPPILCVQERSTIDCLESISNGRADVINIDSRYGYIGRKKQLSTLFYHGTAEQSKVLAVIKESSSSEIKSLSDLRNKNACFPEYGSIAMLAAIVAGKQHKVVSFDQCDYGKIVSDYFNSACVPGANLKGFGVTNQTNIEKLCSLCRQSENVVNAPVCAPDVSNKYFNDTGALRCLETGDVAFIDVNDIPNIPNDSTYRVICNKTNSLAPSPGLNVDDTCALAITIDSETLVHKNNVNSTTLRGLFRDLEKNFVLQKSYTQTAILLSSKYNNTEDLLFKNDFVNFIERNDTNSFVSNYNSIFVDVEKCTGAAPKFVASTLVFLFLALFVVRV